MNRPTEPKRGLLVFHSRQGRGFEGFIIRGVLYELKDAHSLDHDLRSPIPAASRLHAHSLDPDLDLDPSRFPAAAPQISPLHTVYDLS